LNHIIYQIKM